MATRPDGLTSRNASTAAGAVSARLYGGLLQGDRWQPFQRPVRRIDGDSHRFQRRDAEEEEQRLVGAVLCAWHLDRNRHMDQAHRHLQYRTRPRHVWSVSHAVLKLL